MAKQQILSDAHQFDMIIEQEAILESSPPNHLCYNFFLPPNLIGLVVGRRGCTIKAIMDKTGAKIETPKVNTINRFKVYGSREQIEKAAKEIILTIQSVTTHRINFDARPHSFTFVIV